MSTCYKNENMEFKAIFLNLQLKLPTASRSIMRSILPQKKKKHEKWEVEMEKWLLMETSYSERLSRYCRCTIQDDTVTISFTGSIDELCVEVKTKILFCNY